MAESDAEGSILDFLLYIDCLILKSYSLMKDLFLLAIIILVAPLAHSSSPLINNTYAHYFRSGVVTVLSSTITLPNGGGNLTTLVPFSSAF